MVFTPSPPETRKWGARCRHPSSALGYAMGRDVVRCGLSGGRTHALKHAVQGLDSVALLPETEVRMREIVTVNEARQYTARVVAFWNVSRVLCSKALLQTDEDRHRTAVQEEHRNCLEVLWQGFVSTGRFAFASLNASFYADHEKARAILYGEESRRFNRIHSHYVLFVMPHLLCYAEGCNRGIVENAEELLRESLLGHQRDFFHATQNITNLFCHTLMRLNSLQQRQRERRDVERHYEQCYDTTEAEELRERTEAALRYNSEGTMRWRRNVPRRELQDRRTLEEHQHTEQAVLAAYFADTTTALRRSHERTLLQQEETTLRGHISELFTESLRPHFLHFTREHCNIAKRDETAEPPKRRLLTEETVTRQHLQHLQITAFTAIEFVSKQLTILCATHTQHTATLFSDEDVARTSIHLSSCSERQNLEWGRKEAIVATQNKESLCSIEGEEEEGREALWVSFRGVAEERFVVLRRVLLMAEERVERDVVIAMVLEEHVVLLQARPNVVPLLDEQQSVVMDETNSRQLLTDAEHIYYSHLTIESDALLKTWHNSWEHQNASERSFIFPLENQIRIFIERDETRPRTLLYHTFYTNLFQCYAESALHETAHHSISCALPLLRSREETERNHILCLYERINAAIPGLALVMEEEARRGDAVNSEAEQRTTQMITETRQRTLHADRRFLEAEYTALYVGSGAVYTLQRAFRVWAAQRCVQERLFIVRGQVCKKVPAIVVEDIEDEIPVITMQIFFRKIAAKSVLARKAMSNHTKRSADPLSVPSITASCPTTAAILLQSAWRCKDAQYCVLRKRMKARDVYTQRSVATRLKVPIEDDAAATTIQNLFRVHAARQETHRRTLRPSLARRPAGLLTAPQERRVSCEEGAAVQLQAWVRMNAAQKEAEGRRGERARWKHCKPAGGVEVVEGCDSVGEVAAAVAIQMMVKAWQARQTVVRMKLAGQRHPEAPSQHPHALPAAHLHVPHATMRDPIITLQTWFRLLSAKRHAKDLRYQHRKRTVKIPAIRLNVPDEPLG